MFVCWQLTDIDLHKYYSNLEPQTPTDEEASKRPIVISLRNASFRYHRFNQDDGDYQSNGGNQSFLIGPITGDIKKVKDIYSINFFFFFNNLNIIFQGDLVCIEGPVGGGKTALLNAINGSMNRMAGFIFFQQIDDGL